MAADAKTRDDYARDAHKQLDGFAKKYAELRNEALEAEVQAKTDLEKKIGQAKVKCDAACKKLDELTVTSSARWPTTQAEMAKALADVKSVFE